MGAANRLFSGQTWYYNVKSLDNSCTLSYFMLQSLLMFYCVISVRTLTRDSLSSESNMECKFPDSAILLSKSCTTTIYKLLIIFNLENLVILSCIVNFHFFYF